MSIDDLEEYAEQYRQRIEQDGEFVESDSDQDEPSYFRPVEDVLAFDGQNRYQQDISAKSVDLATSLSYREAADHGDGISEFRKLRVG